MRKFFLSAFALTLSLTANAGSVKFKSPELLSAYRELLAEFPGKESLTGKTADGRSCAVMWETSETLAGTKKNNWPQFHSISVVFADKSNPRCDTLAKAKSYRCDIYYPTLSLDHNVDSLRWETTGDQRILRAVDYKLDESARYHVVNVLRLERVDGELSRVSLYQKTVKQWRDGDEAEVLTAACNL